MFPVDCSAYRDDYARAGLVARGVLDPYRLRRTPCRDLNEAWHRSEECADLRSRQIYREALRIRVCGVDILRLSITDRVWG